MSYAPRQEGDCISDAVMEELVRRLTVVTDTGARSSIHSGPTAPIDKTKLWVVTDENRVPNGRIMIYNSQTSTWVSATAGA